MMHGWDWTKICQLSVHPVTTFAEFVTAANIGPRIQPINSKNVYIEDICRLPTIMKLSRVANLRPLRIRLRVLFRFERTNANEANLNQSSSSLSWKGPRSRSSHPFILWRIPIWHPEGNQDHTEDVSIVNKRNIGPINVQNQGGIGLDFHLMWKRDFDKQLQEQICKEN